MKTQRDFYIVTPREKTILHDGLLKIGTLTYLALCNVETPIYVGNNTFAIRYDDTFSVTPVFFIEELFNGSPFGYIINGQRFKSIVDESTIKINLDNVITTKEPISVDKLLYNETRKFHVSAKLLPEVVEALGVKFVDAHYRTRDRGHEKCYEIWEINGKKVISWWTSCRGPGYSCCYDHPSGFEFYDKY